MGLQGLQAVLPCVLLQVGGGAARQGRGGRQAIPAAAVQDIEPDGLQAGGAKAVPGAAGGSKLSSLGLAWLLGLLGEIVNDHNSYTN